MRCLKTFQKIFFLAANIVLTILVFLPKNVFAQGTCGDYYIDKEFYKTVTIYLDYLLAAAIISSILMIIIGGYRMVVSAGNTAQIEAGKKMIFNALLGLGIAVLSGVIMYILNPNLLDPKCVNTTSYVIEEIIRT